jgi:hypothetical protein
MYVSACVFLDGVHVQAGRSCPHSRDVVVDPEGDEHPVGWTAQSSGGRDA